MRRILSLLLAALLLCGVGLAADAPDFGSEWQVIAAAVDGDTGDAYWTALQTTVRSCGGELDSRKYTEYSRVILACSAIGKDAADVGGYDLVAKLQDYDRVAAQGINGIVFALLALDSRGYDSPVRERYVQELLNRQLEDGGWAMSGKQSDTDMTAMVLQALAPYQADAADAIARGVARLKALQQPNGGFKSYGIETSESCAQVIIALCQLGIPLSEFQTGSGVSLTQVLERYAVPGGYAHTEGGEVNTVATNQAKLALAAVRRRDNDGRGIYDWTLAPLFPDLAGRSDAAEIERACQMGLFNGINGRFCPEQTLTRAQLVTVLWRNAGQMKAKAAAGFSDVAAGSWYAAAVNWAVEQGIIAKDTRFRPGDAVTRQELVLILWRLADCPKTGTELTTHYTDAAKVPSWSREALVWANGLGLLPTWGGRLNPSAAITRAETAVMLVRRLDA